MFLFCLTFIFCSMIFVLIFLVCFSVGWIKSLLFFVGDVFVIISKILLLVFYMILFGFFLYEFFGWLSGFFCFLFYISLSISIPLISWQYSWKSVYIKMYTCLLCMNNSFSNTFYVMSFSFKIRLVEILGEEIVE